VEGLRCTYVHVGLQRDEEFDHIAVAIVSRIVQGIPAIEEICIHRETFLQQKHTRNDKTLPGLK